MVIAALTLVAMAAAPAEAKKGVGAASVLGAAPGLYGTMRNLRFGMNRVQAKKAAPVLFADRRTSYDPVLYGFSFHPRRGLDRLLVHFMVPQAGVERGLTAAWGTPRTCTDTRGGKVTAKKRRITRVWANANRGLQVGLTLDAKGKAEVLEFAPTRALSALWGAGMLGTSPTLQAKRLGAVLSKSGGAEVDLPGPAMSDGVRMKWTAHKGVIAAVEMVVDGRGCAQSIKELGRAVRGFAAGLEKASASTTRARVKVLTLAPGRWRIRVDTADRS